MKISRHSPGHYSRQQQATTFQLGALDIGRTFLVASFFADVTQTLIFTVNKHPHFGDHSPGDKTPAWCLASAVHL